jgi:hypothetical protein
MDGDRSRTASWLLRRVGVITDDQELTRAGRECFGVTRIKENRSRTGSGKRWRRKNRARNSRKQSFATKKLLKLLISGARKRKPLYFWQGRDEQNTRPGCSESNRGAGCVWMEGAEASKVLQRAMLLLPVSRTASISHDQSITLI